MLRESLIFRAIGSIVFFVVNLFAVYLFFRGHNLPGGGFIAGVCSGLSLILLSLAEGTEYVRKILRVDPVRLAATGLALSFLTGLLPLLFGDPFLSHYHYKGKNLPVLGEIYLGTPMLFDLGVFLLVIAVVAKLILALTESTHGRSLAAMGSERPWSSPLEEPIEAHPAHLSEMKQQASTPPPSTREEPT
ncbi:MAG: MnhB domain-containing protein [Opitutales bacterium]